MKEVILLILYFFVMVFNPVIVRSAAGITRKKLLSRIDYNYPEAGDLIISEIMPDPLPAVDLPAKEYIEIFNRTDSPINLDNLRLCVNEKLIPFPVIEIRSGEYMILCSHSDTSLFRQYGHVIGLKSFPALPAREADVWISDSEGKLIHGLRYSSEWYNDKLKESGGWSLEMIDTDHPFYTAGNWEASLSRKGGTPGTVNSVSERNPDPSFYGIENVFPEDSVTLTVRFSETVPDLTESISLFTLEGRRIEEIISFDPLLQWLTVKTDYPFRKGEIYYFLSDASLKDFSGNQICKSRFEFGIPEKTSAGEVLFNELLFNPLPDDPDYLELVNCSGKTFDASTFWLVSINTSTGDTSDIRHLSEERRCVIPGSFYAVTTDCKKVISRYFSSDPEYIFTASSLPSMPDDKGHILLLTRELDLIDEVIYTEKMHYSLLSEKEGIALEKVRPDLNSAESMNWHSASESAGWGTPGAENSVYSSEPHSEDMVVFSSGRISPDNNGYEDLLIIDLKLNGTGNIITITIFDETGGYVRKLTENFLAGNKAFLIWDGTAEDGSLVRPGIYIIDIQLYNDKGKTRTWRKVCTVVR